MDSTFRYEAQYFHYNPKWFVRCAINFTRFHLHCSDSPLRKAFDFPKTTMALLLAMYPLGCLAYLVDKGREQLRSLQFLNRTETAKVPQFSLIKVAKLVGLRYSIAVCGLKSPPFQLHRR